MEGVIITDTMEKYAQECEKADVTSRQPPLSAEQMRQQVQRIHMEGIQRSRKTDTNKEKTI